MMEKYNLVLGSLNHHNSDIPERLRDYVQTITIYETPQTRRSPGQSELQISKENTEVEKKKWESLMTKFKNLKINK